MHAGDHLFSPLSFLALCRWWELRRCCCYSFLIACVDSGDFKGCGSDMWGGRGRTSEGEKEDLMKRILPTATARSVRRRGLFWPPWFVWKSGIQVVFVLLLLPGEGREKISRQKMTPSFTRALGDFARRAANSPLADANSPLAVRTRRPLRESNYFGKCSRPY
jgi:hypothetical protein